MSAKRRSRRQVPAGDARAWKIATAAAAVAAVGLGIALLVRGSPKSPQAAPVVAQPESSRELEQVRDALRRVEAELQTLRGENKALRETVATLAGSRREAADRPPIAEWRKTVFGWAPHRREHLHSARLSERVDPMTGAKVLESTPLRLSQLLHGASTATRVHVIVRGYVLHDGYPGPICQLEIETREVVRDVNSSTRRFEKASATLLLDGRSRTVPTDHLHTKDFVGSTSRGYESRDSVVLDIPTREFFEMCAAEAIAFRVGRLGGDLHREHLELLKDLASRLPSGNKVPTAKAKHDVDGRGWARTRHGSVPPRKEVDTPYRVYERAARSIRGGSTHVSLKFEKKHLVDGQDLKILEFLLHAYRLHTNEPGPRVKLGLSVGTKGVAHGALDDDRLRLTIDDEDIDVPVAHRYRPGYSTHVSREGYELKGTSTSITFPMKVFLQLARAKRVVLRHGRMALALDESHLTAIRDMASRLRTP